jgi:hypothetical protein
MHDTGKSTYAGKYKLTKTALEKYKISADKFGSTEVLLNDGGSFTVKDYEYRIDDSSIGMRMIPINDYGSVESPDRQNVDGYKLLEDYIRERQSLKSTDNVYAYLNYFHPEQNRGTVIDLATKMDKAEMGFTHVGVYFGKGYTTNAPELYHNHKFGVDGSIDGTEYGYPAHIQVVSMEGTDQGTLNRNLHYVDTVLNNGVQFPVDYKSAKYRPVDINTALMFYRDWILRKKYLWDDETWYTYCAAHKSLVLTIALNLPHNEDSFKEVYGNKSGKKLYAAFVKNYSNIIGPCPGFTDDDRTFFEPLWKKEQLKPAQIKPFSKIGYDLFDFARRHKLLSIYPGKKPLASDLATPWAPQHAGDVLYGFVQAYADFLDAGAVTSCQIILGFMPEVELRVGISTLGYLGYAMPVLRKIMLADASVYAKDEGKSYIQNRFQQLYTSFGGKTDSIPEFTDIQNIIKKEVADLRALLKKEIMPAVLAGWSLLTVIEQWHKLMEVEPLTNNQAYEILMESVQKDLQNADSYVGPKRTDIEFLVPPALFHMVCIGMHNSNRFIKLEEICTVMDQKEMELKESSVNTISSAVRKQPVDAGL